MHSPSAKPACQTKFPSWGMVMLFPISLALFASVHRLPRLLLAVTALVLGTHCLLFCNRNFTKIAHFTGRLVLLALLISAAAFLPLGPGLRALLQPELADHLDAALALGTSPVHTLAIDPAAWLSWAWGAAMVVLAAGGALLCHDPVHVRRLMKSVVFSALGLCALAAAQTLTHAQHIYWVSSIPAFQRDPFFGSVVNPNHAGTVLAVAIPLCITTLRTRPILASAGTILLGIGTLATHSRGAVLAAGIAVVGLILLAGRARARIGVLLPLLLGIVAALIIGPEQTLWKLSTLLVPHEHLQELVGHRRAYWAEGWTLVRAAPWAGVGAGGFEDAYRVVKQIPHFSTITHAHNEPLQALIEHGIPGALIWSAAILTPVVTTIRTCIHLPHGPERTELAGRLAALLALLATTLWDFPTRIGALSILLALLLGSIVTHGPMRHARLHLRHRTVGVLATVTAAALAWGHLLVEPEAHVALGESAEAVGNHREAAQHYQAAIQTAPLHYSSILQLGRLQKSTGDLDAARETLMVGARNYPTLPWNWMLLAQIHIQQGNTEAALTAWRQMLSANLPNNDHATTWIEAALATGDDPIHAARTAIPNRADRLRQAARMLGQMTAPEAHAQAEEFYRTAIELDSRSRLSYAKQLLDWGRPLEALATITEFDESCSPTRIRAQAHLQLQQYPNALDHFEIALKTCGETVNLKIGSLISRLGAGDLSAIPAAEAALLENPTANGLRRMVIASMTQEVQKHTMTSDRLFEQYEMLMLEGNATLQEMNTYTRLLEGTP